jgi:hypothetical protein
MQQLTLTSYLSLILVGFECVVIWYLTTVGQTDGVGRGRGWAEVEHFRNHGKSYE